MFSTVYCRSVLRLNPCISIKYPSNEARDRAINRANRIFNLLYFIFVFERASDEMEKTISFLFCYFFKFKNNSSPLTKVSAKLIITHDLTSVPISVTATNSINFPMYIHRTVIPKIINQAISIS